MTKQIRMRNTEDLVKWSRTYKKIDSEEVKKKLKEHIPYYKTMHLKESCTIFKKNSYILYTVRMNWKNHKKYKTEGFECIDYLALVPPVSNSDHHDILLTPECQGNSIYRQGRDMTSLKHQAHFFMDVILTRNKRDSQKDSYPLRQLF